MTGGPMTGSQALSGCGSCRAWWKSLRLSHRPLENAPRFPHAPQPRRLEQGDISIESETGTFLKSLDRGESQDGGRSFACGIGVDNALEGAETWW